MRVNQVVVIPAFSNDGNLGRYYGKMCEYDALMSYFATFVEFLEHDRVPHIVQKAGAQIFPNSLVIYCGIGWEEDVENLRKNFSLISYSQTTSRRFCEFFMETSSEWGRCYVNHGHKARESSKSDSILMRQKDTIGVSIEPFKANGELYREYIKHAPTLGKMLANSVYEFLVSREEHPRMQRVFA